MSREHLEKVDEIRKSKLLSISKNDNGTLKIQKPPPTKAAGLYWIYTSYANDEIKTCSSANSRGAIDIHSLANLHDGLPHICSIEQEGSDEDKYRLVYNGIAGKSVGIRGRIHQHFNGGEGTGCLAISKSSLSDISKWRVSYLVLEHDSEQPDIDLSYDAHAKNLERIWRLKFGWPLLCKT